MFYFPSKIQANSLANSLGKMDPPLRGGVLFCLDAVFGCLGKTRQNVFCLEKCFENNEVAMCRGAFCLSLPRFLPRKIQAKLGKMILGKNSKTKQLQRHSSRQKDHAKSWFLGKILPRPSRGVA